MKKSKKFVALVLAVIVCFCSLLVFAYANDNVYFKVLRSDSDDTNYGTMFYYKRSGTLYVFLNDEPTQNTCLMGSLIGDVPKDVYKIEIHGGCVEIYDAFNDMPELLSVVFDCIVVYDIDSSFNNCPNLRKIDFQASIGDGEWDCGRINNSFNNLCELGVGWIGFKNPCELTQVTNCFANTEIHFCGHPDIGLNGYKVSNGKTGVDITWENLYGGETYISRYGGLDYKFPGAIYVDHFTDENVESGKEYTYKISPTFEEFTITYLSKPVVTSCVSSGSNKATIKWQKVEGAEGYYVYQSTTGKSGSWKKIGNLSADKLSCTATGLKTNTKYYFCVKAYSGKDVSYGTTKTVTVGVPTILSAQKNGENITLKWAQQSNTAYYRIYAKAPGDSAYTRVATITNPKTTSYTFKQFSENGTQIKVRAFYTSNGKTTYATTPLYTVK